MKTLLAILIITSTVNAGIIVQVPWYASIGDVYQEGLSPPISVELDIDRSVMTIGPWDFSTDAMTYTYDITQPGGTYISCDLTSCTTTVIPDQTTTHTRTVDPIRFVSDVPFDIPITAVSRTFLRTQYQRHSIDVSGTDDGVPWAETLPIFVNAITTVERDDAGAIVDFTADVGLGRIYWRGITASAVPEPSAFALLGLLAIGIAAWRKFRNK